MCTYFLTASFVLVIMGSRLLIRAITKYILLFHDIFQASESVVLLLFRLKCAEWVNNAWDMFLFLSTYLFSIGIYGLITSWNMVQTLGSGYSAIVVPCHSCIQSLDALKWVGSTNIQRLDAIMARYYSCTTGFPQTLMCLEVIIMHY